MKKCIIDVRKLIVPYLFIEKWESQTDALKEFTDYFKEQWIYNEFGWFEGYVQNAPSHNNALEASNRVIKDENTFRERIPIDQFLEFSRELIKDWSIKRNENTPNAKI